jgi:hypothetical protein
MGGNYTQYGWRLALARSKPEEISMFVVPTICTVKAVNKALRDQGFCLEIFSDVYNGNLYSIGCKITGAYVNKSLSSVHGASAHRAAVFIASNLENLEREAKRWGGTIYAFRFVALDEEASRSSLLDRFNGDEKSVEYVRRLFNYEALMSDSKAVLDVDKCAAVVSTWDSDDRETPGIGLAEYRNFLSKAIAEVDSERHG